MARLTSAATARNRDPILTVLREWLPSTGLVLEIASGAGEHAVYMARGLPELTWQPTDRDATALSSIEAWRVETGLPNLRPPLELDASAPDTWRVGAADAVVCINMIHISPWPACLGLLAGAARVLAQGGVLYLYGPYLERDRPMAPSNEAFDHSLKARDPQWGLRDRETVVQAAELEGLEFAARIEMPANNLSLIFRKGWAVRE